MERTFKPRPCRGRGSEIIFDDRIDAANPREARTKLKEKLGVESLSGIVYAITEIPVDLIREIVDARVAELLNGTAPELASTPAPSSTGPAKMIELIKATPANGVVFISGEVHWGEISVREVEGGYPLHDITASALNQTRPTIEPNQFRIGEPERGHNFGMIGRPCDCLDAPGSLCYEDESHACG